MFQKNLHSGSNRDFREMQETETIDKVQSKDSLAVKKESSEGSGLLSSIDHGFNPRTGPFGSGSSLCHIEGYQGAMAFSPYQINIRNLSNIRRVYFV